MTLKFSAIVRAEGVVIHEMHDGELAIGLDDVWRDVLYRAVYVALNDGC